MSKKWTNKAIETIEIFHSLGKEENYNIPFWKIKLSKSTKHLNLRGENSQLRNNLPTLDKNFHQPNEWLEGSSFCRRKTRSKPLAYLGYFQTLILKFRASTVHSNFHNWDFEISFQALVNYLLHVFISKMLEKLKFLLNNRFCRSLLVKL